MLVAGVGLLEGGFTQHHHHGGFEKSAHQATHAGRQSHLDGSQQCVVGGVRPHFAHHLAVAQQAQTGQRGVAGGPHAPDDDSQHQHRVQHGGVQTEVLVGDGGDAGGSHRGGRNVREFRGQSLWWFG